MPSAALRLAFVMDPVEAVDVRADTSFALMLEARRRGHHVLHAAPGDLGVEDGRATARLRPVEPRPDPERPAETGAPRHLLLDDAVDLVLQREDPPVDADYVTATQILGLCRRAPVWNRPAGILAANEKLAALQFADLMTDTLVTRRIPELVDFMAKMGGEMILKPLEGKGGEGIFHLRHGDRNFLPILEVATRFETHWVMAQRYLPAVRRGDKRILLLEGEPLGAVLRVPAERETRANLHVGGRAAPARLDDADRRIVERLAPWLRREGLFFVGIDVIGGKLTEVNVTSPTGLQEMSRLDEVDYAGRVLERIEAHARAAHARSA